MKVKCIGERIATALLLLALCGTAGGQVEDKLSSKVQVQGQGIVFSRQGFHPPTIQRPAGRVVFFINNRSNIRAPIFQLDRENDKTLQRSTGRSDKRTVAQAVDLTPGTYILSEVTQPDKNCRIVVTAK